MPDLLESAINTGVADKYQPGYFPIPSHPTPPLQHHPMPTAPPPDRCWEQLITSKVDAFPSQKTFSCHQQHPGAAGPGLVGVAEVREEHLVVITRVPKARLHQ